MKPFDLELAKQGHPVCSRDGRPVRILCFDAKPPYCIVALIGDEKTLVSYKKNGHYTDDDRRNNNDLFMASTKHEGWINLYKQHHGTIIPAVGVCSTEEEAKLTAYGSGYITTIKIEWDE